LNGWCWESVLCSDPEMLIRQASRQSEEADENPLAAAQRALVERRQVESLRNPTDAMKAILKRMEERERERQAMTWQQQLQQLTKAKRSQQQQQQQYETTPNPLTPAMEEVMRRRATRVSFEYDVPITPEPSDSEEDDEGNEEEDERQGPLEDFPPLLQATPDKKISQRSLVSLGKRSSLRLATPVKRKALFNRHGEEMSALDDGLELDDDLLQLLREEGVSLAQQREALLRFKRASPAMTRAKSSLAKSYLFEQNMSSINGAIGTSSRIKYRRISIQNDVSPIRNKNSPPDPAPSTSSSKAMSSLNCSPSLVLLTAPSSLPKGVGVLKRRGKKNHRESWVTGSVGSIDSGHKPAEKLSSIPETSFFETVAIRSLRTSRQHESTKASTTIRRRRTTDSPSSPAKTRSRRVTPAASTGATRAARSKNGGNKSAPASRRSSPEPTVIKKLKKSAALAAARSPSKPRKRSIPSSSSAPRRRMRARHEGGSWSWEQIILSDPDKVAKKKKPQNF